MFNAQPAPVLYGKLVARVSVPTVNSRGEFGERMKTVVLCQSCTVELATESRAEVEARGRQGECVKMEWFEWVPFPVAV